jgi:hypothetical protein
MSTRSILVLGLFAMVLSGCGKDASQSDSPTGTSSGKSSSETSKPDLTKPEFTFTAVEWFDEFKKDPKGARAKYANKVVKMTGEIESMTEEGPKDGFVTSIFFKLGKTSGILRAIVDDPIAVAKYGIGNTVEVVGVFLEKMPFIAFQSQDGDLFHCTAKVLSGEPTLVVKTDDLFKDFQMNKGDAKKKYDELGAKKQKRFIVEGVVESITKKGESYHIQFKGSDPKTELKWNNPSFAVWRGIDKIVKGNKVRIYTELYVSDDISFFDAMFLGKVD